MHASVRRRANPHAIMAHDTDARSVRFKTPTPAPPSFLSTVNETSYQYGKLQEYISRIYNSEILEHYVLKVIDRSTDGQLHM